MRGIMLLHDIFNPKLPILYHWSDIVPDCAQFCDDITTQISSNLNESDIDKFCNFNSTIMTGFFTSLSKSFLTVTLRGFKNYEQYIGIREFGIHLYACQFLIVEPGLFVKVMNPKMSGELTTKEILKLDDLDAWTKVVQHCIQSALKPYREMAAKGKIRGNIPII
jgi:hypothetical protein